MGPAQMLHQRIYDADVCSVDPAVLMAAGLIAVFILRCGSATSAKTAERDSVLLCMGDGQGI